MSTLISSAAAGAKAPPKAPPRRRPAPAPGAAQPLKPVPPPTAAPARKPERESLAQEPLPPTPSPVVAQQVRFAEPVTSIAPPADPLPIVTSPAAAQAETITTSSKRACEEDAGTTEQPRKAPKRNSTRSNAIVQIVEQSAPRPLMLPPELQGEAEDGEDLEIDAAVAQQSVRPAKKPVKKTATKAANTARSRTRKVKTPSTVREESDEETVAVQEETGEDKGATSVKKRGSKAKTTSQRAKVRTTRTPRTRTASEEIADTEAAAAGQGDEESESDPEMHEIDPNTLSMFQLSRQKRFGKTSEREKEMQTIDWDEVARKRREAAETPIATLKEKKEKEKKAKEPKRGKKTKSKSQPTEDGVAETIEGDAVEGAEDDENEDDIQGDDDDEAEAPTETRATNNTVGFRVVNGEIVMDEETLTIDRHALATAQIATDTNVQDEASDLTVRVNNATHLNERRRFAEDRIPKIKHDPWGVDETDRFYDALRCWGTDFQIISKMFPSKTRAQIKKKFTREEKLDGDRITQALLGKPALPAARIPVDAAPASLVAMPYAPTLASYTPPISRPTYAPPMSLSLFAHESSIPLADLNKYSSLADAEKDISLSLKDKEEAMQVALREEAEDERQRALLQEQRVKAQEERDRRRAALGGAKRRAQGRGGWGTGGFGGG